MEETIWLEKYRPRTLSKIVGNAPIITKLEMLSKDRNIPNMILTGPPGCGKTTAVLALCRETLEDNFRTATLELNASDERGIDVVRDKIKQFAEKKVKLPNGQHKIIILDEADSLTDAAQQALRMIISSYSETTRFIFSCNDSSKIIEPIQSRCAVLRFNRLTDPDILKFVVMVCEKENVSYEKEGLNALVFVADGDMRNAINNLQAVHVSRGKIEHNSVYEICDIPKLDKLNDLFVKASEGDLDGALNIFDDIWSQNYCLHDLINYLARMLEKNNDIKFTLKFRFLDKISDLRVRDAMGLDSKIQLLGTIAELCEVGEEINQDNGFAE